ncbi:MAG: alpha-D-glucose phosphate-specific phosphoglucomutase, partial [Pseudomonadota bacterium]|nr:alpha-D-glucose phosphate-specific phosphoglucomutase [Pseudomonadota bacterium]
FRLSGTGTDGATLRIYLERYEPPTGDLDAEVSPMLAELTTVAGTLTNLEARTGRTRPDVIT